MAEDAVPLIRRGARLRAGSAAELHHASAELAATTLCELFRTTGFAQGEVQDPQEVRRLVRLDCRRRGIRVQTIASGNVVVIHEDARYQAFLSTPEGRQYSEEMNQLLQDAYLALLPYEPARNLRPVPNDDQGPRF